MYKRNDVLCQNVIFEMFVTQEGSFIVIKRVEPLNMSWHFEPSCINTLYCIFVRLSNSSTKNGEC